MAAEIRFAHLSDWHATTLVGGGLGLLRPKRLSGWASWLLSRRHRHSREILEAAFHDVRSQRVDQILVTGDLTHVSLEQEFREAAEQLERLGSPAEVFLIPGNHDCYVEVAPERSWDLWSAYLAGLPPESVAPAIGSNLTPARPGRAAPRHADYPTLRISGRLAMIGLCSAIPTPIFHAGGELGAEQLARFERMLLALGDAGYCRVVMIHHPVAADQEPARRALWDREAFRAVLARAGADLVLHGHKHRRRVAMLEGPGKQIPAIGVPSASEVGSRPEKRAQYHVYSVRGGDAGQPFEVAAEIRGYDPQTKSFGRVDERLF